MKQELGQRLNRQDKAERSSAAQKQGQDVEESGKVWRVSRGEQPVLPPRGQQAPARRQSSQGGGAARGAAARVSTVGQSRVNQAGRASSRESSSAQGLGSGQGKSGESGASKNLGRDKVGIRR